MQSLHTVHTHTIVSVLTAAFVWGSGMCILISEVFLKKEVPIWDQCMCVSVCVYIYVCVCVQCRRKWLALVGSLIQLIVTDIWLISVALAWLSSPLTSLL